MNITTFSKFLFVTICFPIICLGQTIKVNYDDYIKPIPLDPTSISNALEQIDKNEQSNHASIKKVTQLAINRIVTVISIGPNGNSGSGVFLGLYNFIKNPDGDLQKSEESGSKSYIVIATNYHVAGVAPLTNIAFKDSSLMTFVPPDKKFCHSKKDLCLLFVELDNLLDQQLKDSLINQNDQTNLQMIPSKNINTDEPFTYIGYVMKNCFYSNGTVLNKYSDDNYFLDSEAEQKETSVMLSTNSLFKQGMSGGGVFNKNGQLLGLISFFNVIQNPGYNSNTNDPKYVMGSFFLPTEWISQILDNPKDFKMGIKTNEAPFWFKNQPSFLVDLNKVN